MGRDSSARCDRFPRSRCHRYTQTLRIVCNGTDQHAATATFFPKYKPWSGKRQLRSSSKDSRLNCCQFGAYGTRCLPNRYPMLDRSALIKAGHKGRKKTGHEWVRSEWHQRQDTHTLTWGNGQKQIMRQEWEHCQGTGTVHSSTSCGAKE